MWRQRVAFNVKGTKTTCFLGVDHALDQPQHTNNRYDAQNVNENHFRFDLILPKNRQKLCKSNHKNHYFIEHNTVDFFSLGNRCQRFEGNWFWGGARLHTRHVVPNRSMSLYYNARELVAHVRRWHVNTRRGKIKKNWGVGTCLCEHFVNDRTDFSIRCLREKLIYLVPFRHTPIAPSNVPSLN